MSKEVKKTPVVSKVQKKKVVKPKVVKKPLQKKKKVSPPICKKCVEIHKRDTKEPVQCPYCKEIIGCFWHPSGFHKHLQNCKKRAESAKSGKNNPAESPTTGVSEVSSTYSPRVGRPPKYKTVNELVKIIDEYFRSCWKQKIDMFGNPIFVKDKSGKKTNEPVMVQVEPYTVTDLARAVGMSRQALIDYEKKDEFLDTIKRAKQICEGYAEKSLYVGKNPTGAIFNLKNNWLWKDKVETEHSGNLTWTETPPK